MGTEVREGGMVLYLGMSGAGYWLEVAIGIVMVDDSVIIFVVTYKENSFIIFALMYPNCFF